MIRWEPTEAERRAVLLIEAVALIHDIGKMDPDFLRWIRPRRTRNNYRILVPPRVALQATDGPYTELGISSLEDLQNNLDSSDSFQSLKELHCRLMSVYTSSFELLGECSNVGTLLSHIGLVRSARAVECLFKGNPIDVQIARLIKHIHGKAHYEKGDGEREFRQEGWTLWRATPFGSEQEFNVNAAGEWMQSLPVDRLTDVTKKGPFRQKWLDEMEKTLSLTITDTRRPINEIPLWDWGYVVASLVKATLAECLRKDPENSEAILSCKSLSWRTLSIGVDRIGRYERSNHISDIKGIGSDLDKSFASVRRLLEEEYALANRFFRDESGEYYLFPNLEVDDRLRAKIDDCFPRDLRPEIIAGQVVSDGGLDPQRSSGRDSEVPKLVVKPRKEMRRLHLKPDSNDGRVGSLSDVWTVASRPPNTEVCRVCGTRPVGWKPEMGHPDAGWVESFATAAKGKERGLCAVCLSRRGRRSEAWWTNELASTIWIDEVADEAGRCALLIGSLGLEPWLSGEYVETIQVSGPNHESASKPSSDLAVEDRAIGVSESNHKSASPACLYRIQEAAREFWVRVTEEARHRVQATSRRLHIEALVPGGLLGDFHSYELAIPQGPRLTVVWNPRDGSGAFLSVENLEAYCRRAGWENGGLERLKDLITQAKVKVFEGSEYGKGNRELTTVQIGACSLQETPYSPLIEIMSEPSLLLLLIPGAKSHDVVQAVREAYKEEFGRVKDRLPLRLGVVYFRRHLPIRVVLETGQALLAGSNLGRSETWRLIGAEPEEPLKLKWDGTAESPVNYRNLTWAVEGSSRGLESPLNVTWSVPVTVGDEDSGRLVDLWYPYLRVGENPQLRHALELKPCQDLRGAPAVQVDPSTFDFEFLDHSGQRFAIEYDQVGRRRGRRSRPFYLEHLDRLDAIWKTMLRMSVSQRYQVIQRIESTRSAWFGADPAPSFSDSTFTQFVRDTLAGATWKAFKWKDLSKAEQDELVVAAVSGELADMAELHMQILKEKD